MNDQFKDDPGEESFEDLLNAYSSGMDDSLAAGDKIKGSIISIGGDAVYIDTGTKVDGVVEKAELLDDNGECPYKEGDTVELYVTAVSEHEIRLSRALSGIGGLEMLQDAHQGQVPVEGKVTATQKGGFQVEVLQRRAFCPISQMDVKFVETPGDYVGQKLEFLIARLEENGKNIVLSRRKLLEAQMAESREQFFADLSVGQTLEGVVTKLMPYGVFVEISPGVEGMAHISELSWSRIETPAEAVAENQRITVKVIGVEPGESPDRRKISLSVKQVENDPWESVESRFQEGEKVEGKVTRTAQFGAFVEIAPGIEGLVHISEMSRTRRLANVEEVASPGQAVTVTVKEIDLERRRISLSLKDAEEDPWKDAGKKFGVGAALEGTIVKKEAFGYFIELAPGVSGLMPKSKIREAGLAEIDKAKVGDVVPVTVIHADPQSRKITLAPQGAGGEQDWRKFQDAPAAPMSDLAAKLQEALQKKK